MNQVEKRRLMQARAIINHQLQGIPGVSKITVVPKGVEPAQTRTQQIADILYDSDDMNRWKANQS